jgi:hypothetical protein
MAVTMRTHKRTVIALLTAGFLLAALPLLADEGGVSIWLPGNFGSFAALPSAPGWAMPVIYYHSSASEGGSKVFPRNGRLTAGADATANFVFVAPTYVFATPVAGGQASLGVASAYGPLKLAIDATLTGPNGNTVSGHESDSRSGFADLYPMFTLKWNRGVHNFMTYTMADAPVGTYDVDRLANISPNHWAFDAGGGYTYFDKKNEFSAAFGLSYNLENHDTHYKNGTDAHFDWAASHFISPEVHAGVVGYFYNQLTGDSGTGAKLGDFKSRVYGVGPEVGRFFKVGGKDWYGSVKGYYEFGAKNRAQGFNVSLILAIPLG